MRITALLLSAAMLAAGDVVPVFSDIPAEPRRPNIVVIVADDMGFSDLGCYGGEIATPNLDSLAANGMRFTQFYNTGRCWPTRCALMTGYYPQQIRMDPFVRGNRLPEGTALLPHYLKPLGYRCYQSGKWHVNGAPRVLADGGFDHSYHLKDHDRNFGPQRHDEDDRPLPPVAPDTGFYTTTAITNHSLRCLDDHARDYQNRPFFLYTAYTVPHFPLQAPSEDIARYRPTYRVGWDAIRRDRHRRMLELGLVSCDLSQREDSCGPPYRFPNVPGVLGDAEVLIPHAWETLNADQQSFQAMKMAIHAAMIDRMDREIGRLAEKLRELEVWDDTIIFFFSDNGASAEVMIRGDGHDPAADPGTAGSYLCLGPGWSTAANTPLRRHKVWNHEGGIATPLIVHWPQGMPSRGTLSHSVGHVIDLVPTLMELTGAAKPADGNPVPLPGNSLLAAIHEKADLKRTEPLYFEHEGNAALRLGDWKCLYTKTGEPAGHPTAEKSEGTHGWALYDLADDRSEQHDLAAGQPERLQEMVAAWRKLHRRFQEDAARQ